MYYNYVLYSLKTPPRWSAMFTLLLQSIALMHCIYKCLYNSCVSPVFFYITICTRGKLQCKNRFSGMCSSLQNIQYYLLHPIWSFNADKANWITETCIEGNINHCKDSSSRYCALTANYSQGTDRSIQQNFHTCNYINSCRLDFFLQNVNITDGLAHTSIWFHMKFSLILQDKKWVTLDADMLHSSWQKMGQWPHSWTMNKIIGSW